MAVIENSEGGTTAKIETTTGALRTVTTARGVGYSTSVVTGAMPVTLAANSCVFAMRLDPSSANRAFIDRVRLQFTTIAAFTAAVTAGRRLALFRGSGAATTGGAAVAAAVKKHSPVGTSEFDAANGGDIRIATTAALTVTGITFENDPIATMTLTHVGAAGGYYEWLYECSASESSELVLEPGQLLAVRLPAAMDGGGTWQLAVNAQWREAPLY